MAQENYLCIVEPECTDTFGGKLTVSNMSGSLFF